MIKETELWPLDRIRETFPRISFPEYQREPNVWTKSAKQRLVDSIMRQFDIASIYMYESEDETLECIDGRQRLGAIMSFFGDNPDDSDNGFALNVTNEIYPEDDPLFGELNGFRLSEIAEAAEAGDATATEFMGTFHDYRVTVVKLAGSRKPEEFNLQFTRLNLGTIINSGEKLHAMVGDMRDTCFAEDSLGDHPFLHDTNIPTRRFAQQQLAAQILAQIVTLEYEGEYARTRHFDLQRLFKQHSVFDERSKQLVQALRAKMDLLRPVFEAVDRLRNRAMIVSTMILAWQEDLQSPEEAQTLADFMDAFLCRLKWQIQKGFERDEEYHYLFDFQRHVTQASVEKYAVRGRAEVLTKEFDRWKSEGRIRGDLEYHQRTDGDPSTDCDMA